MQITNIRFDCKTEFMGMGKGQGEQEDIFGMGCEEANLGMAMFRG